MIFIFAVSVVIGIVFVCALDLKRVHVKKVWSPMSPTAPLNGFENGHDVPSTDPEVCLDDIS